jgi:eukaryotic-like serine/threonine-protein kinase
MIGQSVGNYRITGLLGQGGMGMVYLAEHPGIGRKAAVKILHPALARDRDMVTRFLNEARAVNAIHHPGIVEIFDSGSLDQAETWYIVMEFLDGESLAARLRRGRMPLPEALEIGRQACLALGAAHAKGIIHRDLKPDNLFLVPDPNQPARELVKVLDFGIAKLSPGPTTAGSVRTRTGAVLGTPLYMSPEQCRGTREIDHRTDVYALGVILYEMVCGRPPFFSEGFGELAHLHISAPPPPPRQHVPGLPRDVEQLLLRALQKDPPARFSSMAELYRALGGPTVPGLEPATQALPAPPTVPNTTLAGSATGGKPSEQRRRPRVGLVIGASAALVAAGFWAWRSQPLRPAVPPAQTAPAPAVVPPAQQVRKIEAAKTIDIAIQSVPSGALLVRERDGAVLGQTPFREAWPAGTGVEKLHLELEGHHPESVVVPLAQGLSTRVPLRRAHEAARRPKGKPGHPAPKAPPTEPKAIKPREPVPI